MVTRQTSEKVKRTVMQIAELIGALAQEIEESARGEFAQRVFDAVNGSTTSAPPKKKFAKTGEPRVTVGNDGPAPKNVPEAVVGFLANNAGNWRIAEIRDRLPLPRPCSHAAVQVALSRLTKDGLVKRVAQGLYAAAA